MTTIVQQASQLTVGDTILTLDDKPVAIKRIRKGFWPNSLIIEWGNGDGDWSCVSEAESIATGKTAVQFIDAVL